MKKFSAVFFLTVALVSIPVGSSRVAFGVSEFRIGESVLDFVTAESVVGLVDSVKILPSPSGSVVRVLQNGPRGKYQSQESVLATPSPRMMNLYFGDVGPQVPTQANQLACVLDYCTITDVLNSDNASYRVAVGAGYYTGDRFQGFVRIQKTGANTARLKKKVDGFDVTFTRVVENPATGDLIVAGSTLSSFDNEVRVIVGRISAASLEFDPTFDGDGFAIIDLGKETTFRDVVVDANGSVYVLGVTRFTAESTRLSFVRKLTSTGGVDAAYGLGGNSYPAGLVESSAVDLSGSGSSLFVLTTSWNQALDRITPRISKLKSNGALDASFSNDGQLNVDSLTTSELNDQFAIDSDALTVAIVQRMFDATSVRIARFKVSGERDLESVGNAGPNRGILGVNVSTDVTGVTLRSVVRDTSSGTSYVSVNRVSAVGNGSSGGLDLGPGTSSGPGNSTQGTGTPTESVELARPSGLAVRALVRGLAVSWTAVEDKNVGYLVTLADEESTRQCAVAAGARTTCVFRKLVPWKTYRVAVASTSGGVLSEALTGSSKPIVAMRTSSSVTATRLIRPPRSMSQGRRSWMARGVCRMSADKDRVITGRTKGLCRVTLVTEKSKKFPRITRSVTVKIGK